MRSLVESVVTREGYELVDVELLAERGHGVVRIYIDTIPPGTKERGVTVDACQSVSRAISDLLDAEDAVQGAYTLEVSSPGLYRPLTKPAHFDRSVGERIKVKTYEKIDERKVFTGVLLRRDGGKIAIDVDGHELELELGAVARANLEPLF
ncbi:MAG: ribosome maturation factor RimP [Deltaproteobacteria bacterium]|nr:ribosome maturation factor RimP [Deltaproteobacteria bacterium]